MTCIRYIIDNGPAFYATTDRRSADKRLRDYHSRGYDAAAIRIEAGEAQR